MVRQLDSFVIDSDSFATVLEYCPGTDLERHLKQNGMLKEAEARGIIIQVCYHHYHWPPSLSLLDSLSTSLYGSVQNQNHSL